MSSSSGFGRRIRDLVEISEKVKKVIAEKDSDGAVSFSYHDDTTEALALQQKLQQLEKYAGNVDKYVKEKIDRPFYEAMNRWLKN
ncbi:hypothetical protein [Streptococcus zhangguiae]|uniref:Uncharacterized protein n=1 Tax=Streptococcus zhangguiae TaxID=2664091 RepID=A0A6I4REK7_9STRE|nr:hypothetical protein [Streptococcus sp. zg-70]MWV55914.1 hypothetical protein [Streptococcus sp. zg-70]